MRAAREDLRLFRQQGEPLPDWRNKLIWGDNLYVMGSLLEEFAGQIDLIYIDPPFATGADFSLTVEIGDEEVTKEPSLIEEKAYRDTWGRGLESYLQMIRDRLVLMSTLLAPTGSIYVHLDWRVAHYVKAIMDEVLGVESFQREIIWRIGWVSGYKTRTENWIRNHETILYYTRTPGTYVFNKEYVPYPDDYVRRDGNPPTGVGMPIEDIWGLLHEEGVTSIQIMSFSQEKVGFPTQKPLGLLQRIIRASSHPDHLVADFFCGSGTTLVAAERLGRRWIGCDLSRWAIHTTRKRLLDLQVQAEDGTQRGCRPFEVVNLGKYERRYWQVNVVNGGHGEDQALWDYIGFIVKLYGAQSVSGFTHLHGRKGPRMVHVGATDAPVTMFKIEAALAECQDAGQRALDVLGWEWEMGLYDLMPKLADSRGIDLRMLQIPREVMDPRAVERGDVHFYELAYLDANLQPDARAKRRVRVVLNSFVIPNPELIPAEVCEKIRAWSDYIDYWAVDWDYRDDTFHNQWQDYRTRRDRSLRTESDWHTYEVPGTYRVMVKVIDIFGNETSKMLMVEMR